MIKLNKLIDTDLDIDIYGVTDDSRKVKDGFLFVATNGYNVDHFDYIKDAIDNGCVFIICDKEIDIDFPHKIVNNLNDYYFELCKKYYDVCLDSFKFIGVTGTDGKTTITSIVKQLIDECAYLGTNGLEIGDEYFKTDNTTPCIDDLFSCLKIISDHNVSTVSMEVSSEALLHGRVKDFMYDIVCFTNITGDHLNVHKSFDNYVECKLRLLDYVKDGGFVVVNGDDDILRNINASNKIMIGFNDYNDWIIKDVSYLEHETIITVINSNNEIVLKSPYKGRFNVYNVVMAYVICLLYGVKSDTLIERISLLKPIRGRCELLDFGQDYLIVLDYAHTINGIKSILDTFKNYDIITVTGSAGGREKEKRSVIGKMVIDKSVISIFTMDDPRYEDVNSIIDEMVGESRDYFRIVDREDAINYALNVAYPGSCVLILGKGRDDYMAINDKKISYSDYRVINNFFNKR